MVRVMASAFRRTPHPRVRARFALRLNPATSQVAFFLGIFRESARLFMTSSRVRPRVEF
jgi:hypothetical protein